MKKFLLLLLLVALAIWGYFYFSRSEPSNEVKNTVNVVPREKILVIGTVGEVPADEIEEYKPFIDYVASKLASQGITKGEVVVAQSPAEMSKFMRQGKVDIYIDSPFPVYVVSKLAESKVLVDRWKKGEQKYHSIIFTKKDSGIKTLNDLKGKTIAFESSYSTSGYFLPKSELIKKGYKLRQKISANDKIGPDEIGYYFTNDQDKVTQDVLNGIAVAGAQNERDVRETAGENMDKLSVVFQSIDVHRHVMVTRKDIDTDLRQSIKDIMVNMDKTEEGKKVLAEFKKTTKLVEHVNPDEVFQGVKELSELVESEIIRQ